MNFTVELSTKQIGKLLKGLPYTTPTNRSLFILFTPASAAFLIEAKQVSIVAGIIEPFFLSLIAASFYFPFCIVSNLNSSKNKRRNELVKAVTFTSISALLCILTLNFSSHKNWTLDYFGNLALIGVFAAALISLLMASLINGLSFFIAFFSGRMGKLVLTLKRILS